MTGQFTVAPATDPEPDHLHVVFALDNGHELRLRDPRRFGAAEFFPDRAAVEADMNAELGPEPFGLDPDYFRTAFGGTARNLKAILLDQTVVAGVGNIYADEACFRAKLHPGRTGKSLTPAECDAAPRSGRNDALDGHRISRQHHPRLRRRVGPARRLPERTRGVRPHRRAVPACEAAIQCARYAGRASAFLPSLSEEFTTKTQRTHKETQREKMR